MQATDVVLLLVLFVAQMGFALRVALLTVEGRSF